MAVRKAGSHGDVAARELKQSIVRQVKEGTGLDIPEAQTIDQMVRTAANSVFDSRLCRTLDKVNR
jgi:hypothetical protein